MSQRSAKDVVSVMFGRQHGGVILLTIDIDLGPLVYERYHLLERLRD